MRGPLKPQRIRTPQQKATSFLSNRSTAPLPFPLSRDIARTKKAQNCSFKQITKKQKRDEKKNNKEACFTEFASPMEPSSSSSSSDNSLPHSDYTMGFAERAVAAGGAAVVSAVLVNPLDVVKVYIYIRQCYFSGKIQLFA